jgi:hypothetical protein
MKIEIRQVKGINLAVIDSENLFIRETQDALDLMADSGYHGSGKIIIHEKNITPDFFNLKTGIAGDILQKFSTYNIQLAIIGDYSKFSSKSLMDFIFESNKYGRINFVKTMEEAIDCLTKYNNSNK